MSKYTPLTFILTATPTQPQLYMLQFHIMAILNLRPPHHQYPWQPIQKDLPHVVRHCVRCGGPEVHVVRDNGDDNGYGHDHHGEDQVFTWNFEEKK